MFHRQENLLRIWQTIVNWISLLDWQQTLRVAMNVAHGLLQGDLSAAGAGGECGGRALGAAGESGSPDEAGGARGHLEADAGPGGLLLAGLPGPPGRPHPPNQVSNTRRKGFGSILGQSLVEKQLASNVVHCCLRKSAC